MKRNVLADSEMSPELDAYIKKVAKNVEIDLEGVVDSITWDMDSEDPDANVVVSVTFHDGSSHDFEFEPWRFAMDIHYISSDVTIIVSAILRYMKQEGLIEPDPIDSWEKISSKEVKDFDGFSTDYTLYYNESEDRYVCIFGDSDLYDPTNTDPDFECEEKWEALEWFDNYEGFDDSEEDIESSCDVKADWNVEDQIDAPETIGKLNPGDEFVNRKGVKVQILEPTASGAVQFKIGDEVRTGSERSIQQMLYRNNYIRSSEDISSMTATDVVRWMYAKYPKWAYVDERDLGDADVMLIFEIGPNSEREALEDDLQKRGVEYNIRNRLKIKVHDDYEDIVASEEFFDKGEDDQYWYFTTHGVQPGSVPKSLNIIEVVDRPEGSYFLTDRVITTNALKYYDLKERVPSGVGLDADFFEKDDADRTIIGKNGWNDFLNRIEKKTGMKVDSAYRRRHKGDNWIELIDDSGEVYDAEITEYNNGDFELVIDNISKSHRS